MGGEEVANMQYSLPWVCPDGVFEADDVLKLLCIIEGRRVRYKSVEVGVCTKNPGIATARRKEKLAIGSRLPDVSQEWRRQQQIAEGPVTVSFR